MSKNKRLDHRVAVVTGAAAGIGRATAELFAEEGAQVVLADIAGEALERVAAAIRESDGSATAVVADVSTEEGVEAVVGTAERRFGPVDVLVNNAGVELKKLVEDTSLEEWNRILRTNLTSAFLMSRRVVPGMKERRRGAIVMNSSVGNFIAATRSSAYGAFEGGNDGARAGTGARGRALRNPGERGLSRSHRYPDERAESGADRGSGGDAPLLVRGHTARAARHPRAMSPSPSSSCRATNRAS